MKQNMVFFLIYSFLKGITTDLRRVILFLKRFILFGILVILILTISEIAKADVSLNNTDNPDPISKGLSHLLDVVNQDKQAIFNPRLVEPVIDFVAATKKPPVRLTVDKTNEATGAYGEFTIRKSLKQMLQLVYHPQIPSFLFSPTSARVAYWKEIQGKRKSLPAIWKMMSTNKPVIISGVEHEVTAPEIQSGAYYQYDQDRTLIFYRYKGSNVFMSLTKQLGVSEVGQKGLVLGADEEWNYFYSGQKGLTKMPVLGKGVKVPGLSKIESYMYDSYSILVYYEPDPGKTFVKVGVFKWVNAGWKNVNMVKEEHVYNGIMRYAKSFKSVIENPHLPSSSDIAKVLLTIEHQNLNNLRNKVHLYFQKLEQKCRAEGLEPGEMFVNLVKSENYIKQMTKKELQSILALEYMKGVLRKDQELNINKKGKPDSI
jgi:hypothetical protein